MRRVSSTIQHYENFPVASWLCPPRLRAPIAAIYHYARTADDMADEGSASAAERLAMLAAYRAELRQETKGKGPGRWPQIFGPLHRVIADWALPVPLLEDLLDAFVQDVHKTRDGAGYADRTELLDYCRRSANPVGRLLLHLYGITDEVSLAQSDAICSALQLINFWQDLSVDIPRGRYYLPAANFTAPEPAQIRELCAWSRELMLHGAPLARRIPGRAGWELRLVVQGGLAILDKISAQGYDTRERRPKLGKADAPWLLWRALWMQ